MNYQKKYILLVLWMITMIPPMYFAYLQYQEGKIVDEFISSNKLRDLPITKETAIFVSDLIRQNFATEEDSFVSLKMSERPFLREDAGFLLTHKEGLCGEGTRVLVELLNRLGFDATRITLYNKELQSAHTLVSIITGGQEFLLDSINSSEQVNRFLGKYNISANDFNVLHYTDNIEKRSAFVKSKNGFNQDEDSSFFFNYYWLYSYEAIPYSKLLTKIGLDVRVFNFNRPNKLISSLAERPNTVMFLIMLVLSLSVVFILSRFRFIKNPG